jgi:hypothetical protein
MPTANGVFTSDAYVANAFSFYTVSPTNEVAVTLDEGGGARGYLARFTLGVPKSAIITAAILTSRANSTCATGNSIKRAIAADSAALPANYSGFTSASYTAGAIEYTTGASAGANLNVDFTSAVQAVVNRSGWVSGNAIVLVFEGYAPSHFEGTLRGAAKTTNPFTPLLVVQYTEAVVDGGNALLMVL